MATATKVRPIFKLKKGTKEELIKKMYLYALRLGKKTTMVPGGEYYLGQKGKPWYSAKQTKVKAIPVGKYVFHLSKTKLTKAAIAKLTRANCHEPVSLTKKANQVVVLKAEIPTHVFITQTNTPIAVEYYKYQKGYPDKWIHQPAYKGGEITLLDLLKRIRKLRPPYKDIHIVTHANPSGWLGVRIDFLDTTKGATYRELLKARQEIFAEKKKGNSRHDVSGKLSAANKIYIKGCRIGRHQVVLNVLKDIFGGKSTIIAPTHFQIYLRSRRKRRWYEYFRTYWLAYPGDVTTGAGKKSRQDIGKEFQRKYPTPKGGWNRLSRKMRVRVESKDAVRGFYHPHPPDLKNRQAVVDFANKHWKSLLTNPSGDLFNVTGFIKREDKPKWIKLSGKKVKVYVYHVRGKYAGAPGKEHSDTVKVAVHHTEEELRKRAKAQHPHPEWYKWPFDRSKSRDRNRIQQGLTVQLRIRRVRTVAKIPAPIIDNQGKFVQAETTNSTYFGKSK